MRSLHIERHRTGRLGWLRAAVLGANDGLISVASLVVGVAAGGASAGNIVLAGTAGLVAGALSMAAGEYVSVRSQVDTEAADLERERRELTEDPGHEIEELTAIYVSRGLDKPLARQVAVQLTAHDALGAHARDELGITETLRARPIQAALASALAFALGAVLPVIAAAVAPASRVEAVTVMTTLAALMVLGATAAWAGGASPGRGSLRVTFWGTIAMGLTAGVGRLFGVET